MVYIDRGQNHTTKPVERCLNDGCISIGYSIIGDPEISLSDKNYKWIDSIMEQVARDNDLKFDLDVRRLTVGTV